MPDDYEEWYKQQVETGKLPDKNRHYYYCYKEPETIVRYALDKDGWRVGAYVKDPSMFARGNNTGK